jgi:hypothetical protein
VPENHEIQTQYYKGSYTSGTLLKTIGTDYQTLPNPFAIYSDCPTSPEVPIRVTATWPDGVASKVETHEQGQARRAKDRGGEKGDERRRPPRTRPDGWKGPWPPPRGTKWW